MNEQAYICRPLDQVAIPVVQLAMPVDSLPSPGEYLDDQDLVDAYNAVFSIKGGAALSKTGPQVNYAEDLVKRVAEVGAPPFEPLDLGKIRALPRNQLMRLLFKAVAGHFVSGPSSLRSDVCRLQADPVSGALEVVRDGADSEVVLIVISAILLFVLVFMLYKRETEKKEKT